MPSNLKCRVHRRPRPRARANICQPRVKAASPAVETSRVAQEALLQQGLLGFTGGLHHRGGGPDPRLGNVCPRARPEPGCTLHFKFDGDATLYVRVFGEDGRRARCCPENDDRGRGSSPGNDEADNSRAAGGGRGSSSFDGSSSGRGSSSGGCDQPPHRRARLEGGSGSARRRASVKREMESS